MESPTFNDPKPFKIAVSVTPSYAGFKVIVPVSFGTPIRDAVSGDGNAFRKL